MIQANETAALVAVPLVATEVAEDNRLLFFPALFGPRLMLRGEAIVYGWMRKLSPDYTGGLWNFYTLNNGGYYLAPAAPDRLTITVDGNGFEGELSADAAGIVATLFALCQLAAQHVDTEAGDKFAEHYHQLRDFVYTHAEAGAIFRAID